MEEKLTYVHYSQAANSIFVGDYLITGGQPNQLDYDMLKDLGFDIDVVNDKVTQI